MGAMVIHVAHRFKQAYLYVVRALLFHHSNFKNFTREQARTVTSPIPGGRATHYTTQKFPAVPIHYLRYR